MALSSAVDAAVAPPAPNPVHGHDEQSGHAHADHVRAGHSHSGHSPAAPARPTSRRPEVRIGASVLRLSLLARLAIAGTLLAVLWTVVALVVGSEP
ncbi:hypothetical protein [Xanthobacter oligotrophicus]|uniref:hypothetical protein n=1 Tax=Xanthobacter oligotrophicus TaxID=2607286 RepID=UPI0011F35327|nr:hypothetical protein [Xanthobacter oligotrophicus]MCG5234226.1 hypothetical protein [Xanthobacter oligotrophicus]